MFFPVSKVFANLSLIHLLLLSTLVYAQERKRIKTISVFEIHIGHDSKPDTLTKKITSLSFDSTIIDQTVITDESEFFGFPIDHRDSIVLKDERMVFHQRYGKKRQPLYTTYFNYQLNTYEQVIEETDSVYKYSQLANEDVRIHKDSLYTIHKTTYHYNSIKQVVRKIQQSDILNQPSFTDIRYWYNRKGQLRKSVSKGAENEISQLSYDRHGLLVKNVVRSSVPGTAFFFYDDKRRIIKKVEDFSDGKETFTFVYNENGDIWRSENFSNEGRFLKIATFEYY